MQFASNEDWTGSVMLASVTLSHLEGRLCYGIRSATTYSYCDWRLERAIETNGTIYSIFGKRSRERD